MSELSKGKSPFYPGQPVPVDFFVGRSAEIERIMVRGAAQVAAGKPVAIFTQGEYGIGKSSVAGYVQAAAEKEYSLHPIYVSLGGCKDLDDLATRVLVSTIRSRAFDPKRGARIKDWLGKYIGDQSLFGLNLNLSALRTDAPGLSSAPSMLDFLTEAKRRLVDTGVKGIFLVLDEINGISANPDFANFVKGMVDTNALSKEPLPLLLMLCGVEEKRREMIKKHPPVDRIFDVVEIGALTDKEMADFFERSFNDVNMTVSKDAMVVLTHYSAGFPKIMHIVGDAAYWLAEDAVIGEDDAFKAVLDAADDVGRKYVDQQVFKALHSDSYLAILEQIASTGLADMTFTKQAVTEALSTTDKKRFDNFIQRMKKLKVIKPGDVQGEYRFISRMVRLYIGLNPSVKKFKATK